MTDIQYIRTPIDNRPWSHAAIWAFVFAFLFSPVGLILSVFGVVRTSSNHFRGGKLAGWAMALSAIFLTIQVLVLWGAANTIVMMLPPGYFN